MPIDLTTTYLLIRDDHKVDRVPVTDDFWQTIGDKPELRAGRMVSRFIFDADWGHWEMHPHGDELIVVTEGAMTMVIEHPDREERIETASGDAIVVPKGLWHRAEVPERCVAIFATYGRDTQGRPR